MLFVKFIVTERETSLNLISGIGNTAKDKANILNRQYQSVFTKEDSQTVPKPTGQQYPQMSDITITTEGVYKLLSATPAKLMDLTKYQQECLKNVP